MAPAAMQKRGVRTAHHRYKYEAFRCETGQQTSDSIHQLPKNARVSSGNRASSGGRSRATSGRASGSKASTTSPYPSTSEAPFRRVPFSDSEAIAGCVEPLQSGRVRAVLNCLE
uniref:Uncharacterized protein n=1 Tax=Anopheles dirus TaxID=7168 RepID=A0A182NYK8_9DIPT